MAVSQCPARWRIELGPWQGCGRSKELRPEPNEGRVRNMKLDFRCRGTEDDETMAGRSLPFPGQEGAVPLYHVARGEARKPADRWPARVASAGRAAVQGRIAGAAKAAGSLAMDGCRIKAGPPRLLDRVAESRGLGLRLAFSATIFGTPAATL